MLGAVYIPSHDVSAMDLKVGEAGSKISAASTDPLNVTLCSDAVRVLFKLTGAFGGASESGAR